MASITYTTTGTGTSTETAGFSGNVELNISGITAGVVTLESKAVGGGWVKVEGSTFSGVEGSRIVIAADTTVTYRFRGVGVVGASFSAYFGNA